MVGALHLTKGVNVFLFLSWQVQVLNLPSQAQASSVNRPPTNISGAQSSHTNVAGNKPKKTSL